MKMIFALALALVAAQAKADSLSGCTDYEHLDDLMYYGELIELKVQGSDDLHVIQLSDGRVYKVTFKDEYTPCFNATNKTVKLPKKK